MVEKIGLQAVLQDEDFQKGIANYVKATNGAATVTETASGKISVAYKGAAQATKKLGDTTKKETGGIINNLKGMMQSYTDFSFIARDVAQVAGKAWEFVKEGAELDAANRKFRLLTENIGTTADALLIDLRKATRGTRSDMELMAGAGDLVGLGLANTHDEAVRLARVVGALDMNMNQLTLTLTNKTTMRFDSLGVRVAGFNERLKELEATGMDVDAAFTEAFLQQAEQQIEIVGDVADTSAGQIAILEASLTNLTDSMKLAASESVVPFIQQINNEVEAWNAAQLAYENNIISVAQLGVIYLALSTGMAEADEVMQELNERMLIAQDRNVRLYDLTYRYQDISEDATNTTIEFSDAMADLYAEQARSASGWDNWNKRAEEAAQQAKDTQDIISELAGATANLDGSFQDNTSAAQSMIEEWEWAQAGGQDLNDIITEIGGLQVEPDVKRELLEEALTAAVELDIQLGNLTEYEGAQILKDALDLENLEDAKALLSDGEAGILDDIEKLDGLIATAEVEILDYTEEIREELDSFRQSWVGMHVGTFVAVYEERKEGTKRGKTSPPGVPGLPDEDDQDKPGFFLRPLSFGEELAGSIRAQYQQAVDELKEGEELGYSLAEAFVDAGSKLGGFATTFLRFGEKRSQRRLAELNAQLDEINAMVGGATVESLSTANQQKRLELIRQIADEEERVTEQERQALELQKQQEQLGFLKEQMNLLKFIREQGLDPKEILGDIQFGLDASIPDLVEATSKAMQAVIEATNEELMGSKKELGISPGKELWGGSAPPTDFITGGSNYPVSSTSFDNRIFNMHNNVNMSGGMNMEMFRAMLMDVLRAEFGVAM